MWNFLFKKKINPEEKGLDGHLNCVTHWPNNTGDQYPGQWQSQETKSTRSSVDTLSLIPAVYAAVNKIAGAIARMPLELKHKEDDGSFTDADNHPIWLLLKKPNHFQTTYEFVHRVVNNMLLWGNAYVFIQRDRRGVPESLFVLNPVYVQVLMADDGSFYYRINKKTSGAGEISEQEIAPASEIIHFRVSVIGQHPICGMAPLLAAAISANTTQAIQQNSLSFFGNMSRTSGVLTTEQKLQPDIAKRVKEQWEEMTTSRNFGKTAVLSDGLTWSPLTLTAADSQLIDQLNFSISDIARVFSVPPHMLGANQTATYKSAEASAQDFYQHALSNHIENIESRFTESLGLKKNHFVQFDLSSYLKTEFVERMDGYRTAVQSGTFTINEARKKEGLPPVAGGDSVLVQSQNIPLDVAASGQTISINPIAGNSSETDEDEVTEEDIKDFKLFLEKAFQ